MSEQHDAVDVIRTKRDGGRLSDAQIDWVVDAYTRGVVAEEQMSAMAMAIVFRGLSPAELSRWTAAMIASGERLDFSGLSRPTVDKHSTGGVGDGLKVLEPILDHVCDQLEGHRDRGHDGPRHDPRPHEETDR